MSELKVRFIDDTYAEYYNTGKHDLAQVYLKSEVDAFIAELKAENQRLKKCEIWMKQHFFCEEVIACESAKNRKLKRALWLARAEKAKHIANFCYYAQHYGRVPVREIYQCQDKWDKVECKCRAKAEEYK